MNLVLDIHCHTVSSGHAYSTLGECMAEAARKNLKLLAITDHAPIMEGAPSRFHFGNIGCLPDYIYGVELLRGVELNILDKTGAVDLEEEILQALDIVIASMHVPILEPTTAEEHTEALIATMQSPYVDILGHLGDPRYPFDIERVADAAARTGTIIEINNASFSPTSMRMGGKDIVVDIIRACVSAGAMMALGSDAHFHTDVGNFCYLEPLLKELNVPEELILNTSVEKLKAALKPKKRG